MAVFSKVFTNRLSFALDLTVISVFLQSMGFDGILFNGQTLKVRRPRDYQPIPGTEDHSDIFVPGNALWSGTNINREVSTGPIARPFARSLAALTSLTPLLVGK